MRTVGKIFLLISFLIATTSATPQRSDIVDLALVLAVDSSDSVTESRWNLQMEGYAAAFRSPEVIAMVTDRRFPIAVTMVHWSSSDRQKQVCEWRLLRSADDAQRFADTIQHTPRSISGFTSIAKAIAFSAALLDELPFHATRKVIDISGDGTDSQGPDASDAARDAAVEKGITINGLAITSPDAQLGNYYRDHVIGGPRSFVDIAYSYEDFGAALRKKLLTEMAAR